MNLVDDDGLDLGQGVPGRGRKDEEQGFGSGDKDVRRVGGQSTPLRGGGVAGADPDADGRQIGVDPRDPGQWAAQVTFDVHSQRLQRRHVDHAGSVPRTGRVADQPVDGGQERGECLAGTGGGDDQRVIPGQDGLPGARLRGRGGGEGLGEPPAGGGAELRRKRGRGAIGRARRVAGRGGHPTIVPPPRGDCQHPSRAYQPPPTADDTLTGCGSPNSGDGWMTSSGRPTPVPGRPTTHSPTCPVRP